MAGFDNYFRPSGVTYNAQGQVTGATPTYNNAIANTRTQQAATQQTMDNFHLAHPGATTMTTGQLYGVGAPNNAAPSYAQVQQNESGWGNGSDAAAAAGWDQWARNKQQQYGTGAGAVANPTGAGAVGGPSNGNGNDPYGAGYTGYGGSSLTATGNPVYGDGTSSVGGYGGGSGSGAGGGAGATTPWMYTGSTSTMPWVNHPTVPLPGTVTPRAGSTGGYAAPPLLSTLNTNPAVTPRPPVPTPRPPTGPQTSGYTPVSTFHF